MMEKKSNVAILGMFVAVAFVLSYIESMIPLFAGVYGMKLGLANLAVVISLYLLGEKEAVMVSVVRIILVAFTFSNLWSMLYSLAGAAFSLCAMILGKKSDKLSMMGVSVLGGVFHNLGQILVAMLAVENEKLIFYFPVLLVSGVITGALIGVVSGEVKNRLGKVINK